MTFARHALGRAAAVVGFGLAAATADAAESAVGAYVGARLLHTDNITLAPDDLAQSENVADVTTGITFSRSLSRFEADVDYAIQGLFYEEAEDADEVFHHLDASGRAEFVVDRLFLDLFAVVDQAAVDAAGTYSFNNITLIGNRTEVEIIGVSPSLRLGDGEKLAGEIRQSYTKLDYDDPTLLDTAERFVLFNLSNTNARAGGTWGVAYSLEQYEYDITSEIELETFELELGWWLSPELRLFTTQGLESDYATVDPTTGVFVEGGLDEHYWYVGTEWRPDERTVFNVSVGERNFGDAKRFEFSREFLGGGINVSYGEEPNSFLRDQVGSARAAGELLPIDSLEGPRGNRLYLQERFDVAVFLDRPKSRAGLLFFTEKRFNIADAALDLDEEETEEYRGVDLTLEWDISVRTSLNAGAQKARRRSSLLGFDDDLSYLTIALVRQIRRSAEISFTLARQETEPRSDVSTSQREENQVSVGIQRRFGETVGRSLNRYSGYVNAGR
jgi:hypothetical protein